MSVFEEYEGKIVAALMAANVAGYLDGRNEFCEETSNDLWLLKEYLDLGFQVKLPKNFDGTINYMELEHKVNDIVFEKYFKGDSSAY